MYPTPTVQDAGVRQARPPEKMIRKDGRNVLRTPSLAETVMQPEDFPYTKRDLELMREGKNYQAAKQFRPTPTATERSGINPKTGRGAGLSKAVKSAASQAGGKLNPDWVEVLMGFPVGWTDLSRTDIDLTHKFPQAWLDGSWEDAISRTTTRRDGRIARLKQLGNALVPQVVEFIGRAITQTL